jgi:hypothetical protein
VALLFDGLAARVTYTDHALMDGVAKLTIDYDVFFNTLTVDDRVMQKFTTAVGGWRISSLTTNTTMLFQIGAGTNISITQATQYVVNTWQHWTFTYDGGLADNITRFQAYLDGSPRTLTFSLAVPATIAATTAVFTAGFTAASHDGRIANLKIWNDHVSAAEAQLMYRSWRPHKTANLLLWAPYDDAVVAADYSGNGNVGTVTTATQIEGPPKEMGFPVMAL